MANSKFQTVSIICVSLLLSACSQKQKSTDQESQSLETKEVSQATQIVHNSIEAHGGMDAWENLKAIKYSKRVILTDSVGVVESDVLQHHSYTLKPELTADIKWYDGEDTVSINYKLEVAKKSVAGEERPSDAESAMSTIMSSVYVLFQPFKLLDPGTTLIYEGELMLYDSIRVDVIRPVYGEPQEGDDVWNYFFNKDSHLLVANSVDHGDRKSMISNLSYDERTAIIFNHHRKSNFVDEDGSVLYLRAEYFYTDFELTY